MSKEWQVECYAQVSIRLPLFCVEENEAGIIFFVWEARFAGFSAEYEAALIIVAPDGTGDDGEKERRRLEQIRRSIPRRSSGTEILSAGRS